MFLRPRKFNQNFISGEKLENRQIKIKKEKSKIPKKLCELWGAEILKMLNPRKQNLLKNHRYIYEG